MFDNQNPADVYNRQGFGEYLQGQGWDGQGPMWQYAQQLRQQGQHPRWDYRHPGQEWPGAQGLGGLAQFQNQFPNIPGSVGMGQGWGGQHGPQTWNAQSPTAPRPMQGLPQMPQGIAVGEPNPMGGGLMDLARRRVNPLATR